MLKPIFIDNGLSYEDNSISICILLEEEYIPQIMKWYENINHNNYLCNFKDKPKELKRIIITEQLVYDYLKEHNINYYTYETYDTLITQD